MFNTRIGSVKHFCALIIAKVVVCFGSEYSLVTDFGHE